VENGGTLLATTGEGSIAAAEWPAGTVAAGPRMFLSMGSWEADGSTVDTAGKFNLTPVGETALLNAVGIFVSSGTTPAPPAAFAISAVSRDSATGAVTVTWPSEAGIVYTLER